MLLVQLLYVALVAAMTALAQRQRSPRVLVYTATRGFRHDSIPTAIEVLGSKASEWGVEFDFTEDQTQFSDSNLARFDCLMFVHNSDQVLDTAGETALSNYFKSGGAYVGVHGASTCLQNNTNYQQVVGAIFDYHPQLQPVTFLKVNQTHPAMAGVPDQWRFTEEVYIFKQDPRSNGAQLLLTVDESSYDSSPNGVASAQGTPHPIAWYIDAPRSAQPLNSGAPKVGRSFYTSLGHLNETWQNATFQGHLAGGLRWALDGASTRAYGVGLVGNNGTNPSTGSSSSGSTAGSSTVAGSGTASAGASGTVTAPAGQSSRAAADTEGSIGKGAIMGAAAGAVGLSVLLS